MTRYTCPGLSIPSLAHRSLSLSLSLSLSHTPHTLTQFPSPNLFSSHPLFSIDVHAPTFFCNSSLEKLSSGIARLETELHAQVVTRHDDLLLQATGIQKLEDVLKMVSVRVAALSKSFARIHSKVYGLLCSDLPCAVLFQPSHSSLLYF